VPRGYPTTARGGTRQHWARRRAIRPPHRCSTPIAGACGYLGQLWPHMATSWGKITRTEGVHQRRDWLFLAASIPFLCSLSLSLSVVVRSTRVCRGAPEEQGGTQGVLIPRLMRPQCARFLRELNDLADEQGRQTAVTAPVGPAEQSQTRSPARMSTQLPGETDIWAPRASEFEHGGDGLAREKRWSGPNRV
jgi:hypothetical protein